ncbi:MAG: hypothetical protein INF91_04810 [Alphaproteobacteria bacterium]|nr:hypothetical protein [Alphaproteobacteria bacterium]
MSDRKEVGRHLAKAFVDGTRAPIGKGIADAMAKLGQIERPLALARDVEPKA